MTTDPSAGGVGRLEPGSGPSQSRPVLTLHTQFILFERRTSVMLSDAGIAWQERGRKPEFARWTDIGGVRCPSRTQHILALDGSILGSVTGWLIVDGESDWSSHSTNLAHAVALYRPDLFIEVGDGMITESGCIRREVLEFEARAAADGTGSR